MATPHYKIKFFKKNLNHLHLQLKSNNTVIRFIQKDKWMFIYNLENYANICLSAQLCPTFTWVTTKPCTRITKPLFQENNSYSSLKEFFSEQDIWHLWNDVWWFYSSESLYYIHDENDRKCYTNISVSRTFTLKIFIPKSQPSSLHIALKSRLNWFFLLKTYLKHFSKLSCRREIICYNL